MKAKIGKLIAILTLQHIYKVRKESTTNPIKYMYWALNWGTISCVHCRERLARTISKRKVRSCCFCDIKVKEQVTGISQRVSPFFFAAKLPGIWY